MGAGAQEIADRIWDIGSEDFLSAIFYILSSRPPADP